MSRPLLICLMLLALAGCGQDAPTHEQPTAGDRIIAGEDKSAERNGEAQAQVALASAESRTLEARLERLEAEVDTLKAQAATADSLKSALADLGASTAAPPLPAPLAAPTPPSGASRRAAAATAQPTPDALAQAPVAASMPRAKRNASATPARKPPRASPAAELQAKLAPNGVLHAPRAPTLDYDGL